MNAHVWVFIFLGVLKLSLCQDDISDEDVDRAEGSDTAEADDTALDGTAEAGDPALDGTADAGDRALDESAGVGVGASAEDDDRAADVTAGGGLGATAEGDDSAEDMAEGGETAEDLTTADVSAEQALQTGSKAMEKISEIPFGKAKIKYHKSRICIQIGETSNCVVDSEAPGDPEKVAKFVRVYSSMVKPEVSRNNRQKLSKKIKNVKNNKNKIGKTWAPIFEGGWESNI